MCLKVGLPGGGSLTTSFKAGVLLHSECNTVIIILCYCVASLLFTQVPYSMYYKPMGDLPYISSEQWVGL